MISVMFNEIERHLHDLRRRELSFKAGQPLFRLGDRVSALHFVQAGAVHLVRHQSDGSALILQRAAAGSILAEASLYSDTYHCDAISISPTRTLAFDKADLRRRFLASPEFAEAWASALARELQRTRLQAEILSLKTVAARLDAWIDGTKAVYRPGVNGGTLPVKSA